LAVILSCPPEWYEDAFEDLTRNANAPQSLTQLASSPVWLNMVDLFTMNARRLPPHSRHASHAVTTRKSWMIVHYLINKNKLPETGVLFRPGAESEGTSRESDRAGFRSAPATMEEAVKAYFRSLPNLGIALDRSKQPLDQA